MKQPLADEHVPIWQRTPSLNERSTERYAVQKSAMVSRLDVKDAKDKDDEKKIEQWRRDVRQRDKGRCRVCGIKTVKTLELDPKRGEAHHIASRKDKAVRYDIRNGLHACLACHEKFTLGKLFIHQIAKHLFTVGTTTYINASKKVTYSERAAA